MRQRVYRALPAGWIVCGVSPLLGVGTKNSALVVSEGLFRFRVSLMLGQWPKRLIRDPPPPPPPLRLSLLVVFLPLEISRDCGRSPLLRAHFRFPPCLTHSSCTNTIVTCRAHARLCQSLAKRFGLPYLDTQAILTLKLKAKERVDAGDG